MAQLIVVTPNPAVDVTYRVDALRPGETHRVQEVSRRPGGKGLNVARVLHQLDQPVHALQPLGGPEGTWFAEALEALGLPHTAVETRARTRSTVAVVDGLSHPSLFNEPGEPLAPETWERLASGIMTTAGLDGFVILSGSLPPDSDPGQITRLVAAARRSGARVLVDSSGPALVAAAQAGVEVLKPNEEELLAATGADSLAAGARQLLEAGAGAIVVSRGAEGILVFEESTDSEGSDDAVPFTQPAVPGVSGNPTGAGDAAAAGLTLALAHGLRLKDALPWAALLGAAAVLCPVAGEVDVESLPALARRLPEDRRPQLRPIITRPEE